MDAHAMGSGAAIGGGLRGDGGIVQIHGGNVTVEAGDSGDLKSGAVIGGGMGCYDLPEAAHPGKGANFTVTGGTVTALNGWIGGSRDTDSIDFGEDGTTVQTGGEIFVPEFVPPVGISHFDPPRFPAELPGKPLNAESPKVPWDDRGLILQIGTDNEEYDRLRIFIDDMSTRGLMVAGTNILTIENAEEASDWLYYAIGRVSENRGRLGAYQNRLEHNINGLSTAHENMTAAESRLRDADMAKEMASFTMQNVISQAAQAMLAQANQKPNEVMELLK